MDSLTEEQKAAFRAEMRTEIEEEVRAKLLQELEHEEERDDQLADANEEAEIGRALPTKRVATLLPRTNVVNIVDFKGDNPRAFLRNYEQRARLEGWNDETMALALVVHIKPKYAAEIGRWRAWKAHDWLGVKQRMLKEYVDEGGEARYTTTDVRALVKKARKLRVDRSAKTFNAYYRAYKRITSYLTSSGVLSWQQEALMFLRGLGEELVERWKNEVRQQLTTKHWGQKHVDHIEFVDENAYDESGSEDNGVPVDGTVTRELRTLREQVPKLDDLYAQLLVIIAVDTTSIAAFDSDDDSIESSDDDLTFDLAKSDKTKRAKEKAGSASDEDLAKEGSTMSKRLRLIAEETKRVKVEGKQAALLREAEAKLDKAKQAYRDVAPPESTKATTIVSKAASASESAIQRLTEQFASFQARLAPALPAPTQLPSAMRYAGPPQQGPTHFAPPHAGPAHNVRFADQRDAPPHFSTNVAPYAPPMRGEL